jgi:hypothetical protein
LVQLPLQHKYTQEPKIQSLKNPKLLENSLEKPGSFSVSEFQKKEKKIKGQNYVLN